MNACPGLYLDDASVSDTVQVRHRVAIVETRREDDVAHVGKRPLSWLLRCEWNGLPAEKGAT